MKSKHLKSMGLAALIAFVVLAIQMSVNARQPFTLVRDEWPPYQQVEEETMSGFSVDMIQAVYDAMGTPVDTITSYPWKRAMTILEHGHADGLFSANHTADREAFAFYPEEPLLESPWIIWTQDNQTITSLDQLRNKRIGVVLGYSYTPEFWEFIETYCNVEQVSTDEINFKKLELGRIDATVAEYGNGLHNIKTLGLKRVTPQPALEIKRDGLYIIFNRERVNKAFVADFTRHLREFKNTEAYQELWERYFDRKTPF